MKKFVSFTTFITVFLFAFVLFANASNNIVESGSCGKNITYKLYENGELVISGKGEMDDYHDASLAKWYSNCGLVKSITISEGITSVGEKAFMDCWNLVSVKIPTSIKSIGSYAFIYCSTLKQITIPNGVKYIAEGTFRCCESLESIYLPNTIVQISSRAFDDCPQLKNIYYSGDKSQWSNVDIADYENDAFIKAKVHYGSNGNSNIETCTSHKYSNAKIVKATTSANGKKTYTCKTCGYVKTSTINKISSVSLSKTTYTYDGKTKKPSVIVKDSKGNKLKENTDYTVKYASGRKNIGTYKVTVTFKGDYNGKKKLTFKIVLGKTSKISAKQTTSSITLSWKKVYGADGYRIYKYNSKQKNTKI